MVNSILLRPFKYFGPGLILVLTWVGVGDIIGSIVGGSTFGLNWLWILALAPLMRLFVVDQIARFTLYKIKDDNIVASLAKISTGYPRLLLIATLFIGHLFGAYMLKGLGELSALLFDRL